MPGKEKKRVVILGFGAVGFQVAVRLDGNSNFDVTVIERKDHVFYNIGAPRAVTDFNYDPVLPYDKAFKHVKILQATVKEVRDTEVILEGEPGKIEFDYLVIGLGIKYHAPFRAEADAAVEVRARLDQIRKQVSDAPSIVVVGGGATGVETAADIADRYPNKTVTLIHSGKTVLNGVTSIPKFASEVQRKLETMLKVKLVLGDRVVDLPADDVGVFGPAVLHTASGKEIQADLVIRTTGGGSKNNEPLKANFADLINERGELIVNEFLQVKGKSTIFAAGDISSASPVKSSMRARFQSDVVADNIKRMAAKKSLTPYKEKESPLMFLGLGRKHGQAVGIPGKNSVFGDSLGGLKAKSYMIERQKGLLHVK